MIYTAKEGVDRRTKDKVLMAELILVPLFMIGVTAYGFIGSDKPANDPNGAADRGTTLGTNTDNLSGDTSSSTADSGNTPASGPSASAPSGNPTESSTTAKSSRQAATSSPSGTSSPEGGRGGGTSGGDGEDCFCESIDDVLNTIQPPSLPLSPPPALPSTSL